MASGKSQSNRSKFEAKFGETMGSQVETVAVAGDAYGAMTSSAELREKRQREWQPQSLYPDVPDSTYATADERSKSAPPVHRSQPYAILQKRIESFQRRSKRLNDTREEAFFVRMELKFLRQNYRQQHKFVDESQRSLNEHVEFMVQAEDFVATRDDFVYHYGRARGDYLSLQDQSTKLQACEDRLTDLEESMRLQEEQLSQTSERILLFLRHLDPAVSDQSEERIASNAVEVQTDRYSSDFAADNVSSAASQGHPELDEYFDKAGDVGVAKGRLIELLKEQEERREQRNFQEDQGVELEMSEEAFNAACAADREAAQEAIRIAIHRREMAKEKCLELGINPDQHRHGPEVIVTHTGPSGEAVEVDERQEELPRVTETVERWIKSIDEDHIEPLLESVNAEEHLSIRKEPLQVSDSRRELEQYITEHGSAQVIARLAAYGIDLPSSYKAQLDKLASNPRSNHSRSSSETKLSTLIKLNISPADIAALSGFAGVVPLPNFSEVVRGRRL